jgi:hypothetical protein
MKTRFAAGIAVIAALLALPLGAQELVPPSPPPGQSGAARKIPAPIPLKVTVVLSRFQGDKRISSMPYLLGVMASGWGPGPKTTLRMGLEVPVATNSNVAVSPVSYRNVGTNIDCGATFDEATPGLFQLALVVSDSSLGLNAGEKRGGLAADMPSFRSFNSSFTALLRDGQTMQYTSATDPVSGEVMKIDVTAAVMK